MMAPNIVGGISQRFSIFTAAGSIHVALALQHGISYQDNHRAREARAPQHDRARVPFVELLSCGRSRAFSLHVVAHSVPVYNTYEN